MRNMPIRTSDKKPGGRAQRWQRGWGGLALAFVVILLVTSLLGILGFASAYSIHKTINRAALEGAKAVATPSTYDAVNEYVYGGSTGNLSASAVFADYVAPVLRSAHLNPKDVTKYSEQVTWLNPTDPKPQCGVIVYFEYPFILHIPFTHRNLTLIRFKALAQVQQEPQSAAGTCP